MCNNFLFHCSSATCCVYVLHTQWEAPLNWYEARRYNTRSQRKHTSKSGKPINFGTTFFITLRHTIPQPGASDWSQKKWVLEPVTEHRNGKLRKLRGNPIVLVSHTHIRLEFWFWHVCTRTWWKIQHHRRYFWFGEHERKHVCCIVSRKQRYLST